MRPCLVRRLLLIVLCLLAAPLFAQPPQATFHDDLMDHLQGRWTLTGTIAGKATTHDIDAQWVLNHQYLCFRETSRERKPSGEPDYQAAVYFGFDQAASQHLAIWLDIWGGFRQATVGRANRNGNELHFRFNDGHSDFHTIYTYDPKSDTWTMNMDNEVDGKLMPFARTTLTRQK